MTTCCRIINEFDSHGNKKETLQTGEDEFYERKLLYQCAKALCEVVAHWLRLPGFGTVLEKLILP
jgi:hypothetical protein